MDDTTQAVEAAPRVIELIRRSDDPLSPKEISEELGFDYDYMRQLLPDLAQRGEVERVGWGKYAVGSSQLVQPQQQEEGVPIRADEIEKQPPVRVSTSLGPRQGRSMRSLAEDNVTITVYFDPHIDDDGNISYHPSNTYRLNEPMEVLRDRFGDNPPGQVGVLLNRQRDMEPTFKKGDFLWYTHQTQPIRYEDYYAIMIDGAQVVKKVQPIFGGAYRLIPENQHGGYDPVLIEPVEGWKYKTQDGRELCFRPLGPIIYSGDGRRFDLQEVMDLLGAVTHQQAA